MDSPRKDESDLRSALVSTQQQSVLTFDTNISIDPIDPRQMANLSCIEMPKFDDENDGLFDGRRMSAISFGSMADYGWENEDEEAAAAQGPPPLRSKAVSFGPAPGMEALGSTRWAIDKVQEEDEGEEEEDGGDPFSDSSLESDSFLESSTGIGARGRGAAAAAPYRGPSPRDEVLRAQEVNRSSGHENRGTLSFSHGFAPRLSPVTRFPPAFEPWNALCDELPRLLSSRGLRAYCDDAGLLPALDAAKLPAVFALRAATVLGLTAHAYWNIGDPPEVGRTLPEGLDGPWRTINEHQLGRGGDRFVGFQEQIISNFRFEEGKVPSPPKGAEPCPWITEELARYGAVEYDPLRAGVSNYHPAFWMTRMPCERNLLGAMTEMHTVGSPAVRIVVEAGEAASRGDVPGLKRLLEELLRLLTALAFDVLEGIKQQRMAPHHADAAAWAKVVSPVLLPALLPLADGTDAGPAAVGRSPLIMLLDAFFRREGHGRMIDEHTNMPPNWKNFLVAVINGPDVPTIVDETDDRELLELFGSCLLQYAGENNGFLARYRLKMMGYIEVAIKLGDHGISRLIKDRAWDRIAHELQAQQRERFAAPFKSGGLYSVGKIIQLSQEQLDGSGTKNIVNKERTAYQVRIDIEGSGIRLQPGSHVGIFYESRVSDVFKTLLAFANGNKEEAMRLGEDYMVNLNPAWMRALCQREEFHDAIGASDPRLPNQLKLKTFLDWGELRPASHRMLELAYGASRSDEILTILNAELVDALTFSDVVTILMRHNVDILGRSGGAKKGGIDFTKIQANLKKVSRRGTIVGSAVSRVFEGTGLTPEQQRRVSHITSRSPESVQNKILRVTQVRQNVNLCDLVEPSKYRFYSVASSNIVHPNELHLYVHHLKYNTPSAVARTSPLLVCTQKPVPQRGAASDYIVSKSLPRYYLAIEAIAEEAGLARDDDYQSVGQDLKFHLTSERRNVLKYLAYLADEEIDAIVERAKGYSGGETIFTNLVKAIKVEVGASKNPDPRSMSIVMKPHASPRFRLPSSHVPVIMIAGGTGLAPFRAFWQHLAISPCPILLPQQPDSKLTRKQMDLMSQGKKHLLIIGQRTRKNMMFEDEILAMVKAGVLDVEIMFSQDDCVPTFDDNEIVYKDASGRTGYIDTLMSLLQERLVSMICEHGAHMYICGAGGMARTALDSLNRNLRNFYGETRGKSELEKVFAENRFVMNVFTSLVQPKARAGLDLSELCQCNDFLRVHSSKDHRLLLVVNATVYDVKEYLHLHPGGDIMLKFYCGMDATKAWNAVGHSGAREIVAMLEMFDAQMSFRNVEANLHDSEKEWYICGWKEMTMRLVEIQNCMGVAFEKIWDTGTFSAVEKDLGGHFTVWERKAMWRSKCSLLKGELFAATHNRLWSVFLPLLLSDCFDEIVIGMVDSGGGDYDRTIQLLLEQLESTQEHAVCDSVYPLIKQELDNVTAIGSNIAVPPALHSYMEELHRVDDWLLESIKAHLITCLRVFETEKSPLLPAFHATFDICILGIIEDLDDYMSEIMSLTITQFGNEQVHKVANSDNLKHGGIAMVGNTDTEIGHTMHSGVPLCPVHLGS